MPFEVAKNRIQLGLGPRTISANMADTVRTAGPTGLFYGLQAQLVQTAAKSSIRFAAFERFKVYFDTFTAGILAGLTEAIVLVAPTRRLKVLRQAELVHMAVVRLPPPPRKRHLIAISGNRGNKRGGEFRHGCRRRRRRRRRPSAAAGTLLARRRHHANSEGARRRRAVAWHGPDGSAPGGGQWDPLRAV